MNRLHATTTAALALTGAALWMLGASRLSAGGDFDFQPNPLGIRQSPYGQVLALAAQGQIESDWSSMEAAQAAKTDAAESPRPQTGGLLARMEDAVKERTNPAPPAAGHSLYLRRQIEDRLRLAFELDPSNYANYNAYHFFLTEPALGTRPVLNDKVLQLAGFTSSYCMREESDPRASLTAASAAGNVLLLMFAEPEKFPAERMRQQLAAMDAAIARNHALTLKWMESGEFARLSPERQEEMLERLRYIGRSRESAAQVIRNLTTPQASR